MLFTLFESQTRRVECVDGVVHDIDKRTGRRRRVRDREAALWWDRYYGARRSLPSRFSSAEILLVILGILALAAGCTSLGSCTAPLFRAEQPRR
jgi:hypothetical protein